jgi:hypothetical protein
MAILKCSSPTCTEPLKDESLFKKDKRKTNRNGRSYWCKDCHNRSQRVERSTEDGRKRYNARCKRWRDETDKGRMSNASRSRNTKSRFNRGRKDAARRGLAWEISFEAWVTIAKANCCHYCDNSLPEAGHGLDRKDCDLGYTEDNVVSCCSRCNMCRGNYFTYDEFVNYIVPAIRALDEARRQSLTDTVSLKGSHA